MARAESSRSGKHKQKNQREHAARDEADVHAVKLCNESDCKWPRHIAKFLEGLGCTHACAQSVLINQCADQSIAVRPDCTDSDTRKDNKSEKRDARCERGGDDPKRREKQAGKYSDSYLHPVSEIARQRLHEQITECANAYHGTGFKWCVTDGIKVNGEKSEENTNHEHADDNYGVDRQQTAFLENEEELFERKVVIGVLQIVSLLPIAWQKQTEQQRQKANGTRHNKNRRKTVAMNEESAECRSNDIARSLDRVVYAKDLASTFGKIFSDKCDRDRRESRRAQSLDKSNYE
jgi:hypothetical protein